MLNFKREQLTFDLNGIKVGGNIGENPTLLIGTIFYHGQKIVHDEKKGEFDRKRAEGLIHLQEEFSEKTGNSCMLDVVGSTEVAIEKFIGFVAGVTEAPFLVDSPTPEVKIAGVKYAKEVGLEKRVVYNSLTTESKPEEFETLRENGVESSILLAFSRGLMTGKDRVEAIKELLPRAEKAKITKPLIDTFTLDVISLKMANKAMFDLKQELGLPCGCGAHNAISTWKGLKKRFGVEAVKPCTAVVNTVPVVLGADFILYGPVEDCKYVFPSIYIIDTLNKTKDLF